MAINQPKKLGGNFFKLNFFMEIYNKSTKNTLNYQIWASLCFEILLKIKYIF